MKAADEAWSVRVRRTRSRNNDIQYVFSWPFVRSNCITSTVLYLLGYFSHVAPSEQYAFGGTTLQLVNHISRGKKSRLILKSSNIKITNPWDEFPRRFPPVQGRWLWEIHTSRRDISSIDRHQAHASLGVCARLFALSPLSRELAISFWRFVRAENAFSCVLPGTVRDSCFLTSVAYCR